MFQITLLRVQNENLNNIVCKFTKSKTKIMGGLWLTLHRRARRLE